MHLSIGWESLEDAVRRFDLVRRDGLGMLRVVAEPDSGRCRLDLRDEDRLVTTVLPAEIIVGGAALAPAVPFHDFVRACTAERGEIRCCDDRLDLRAGSSRMTLHCYDMDVWPRRDHTGGQSTCWSAEALTELGRVVHAVAGDMSRPALAGVQIKEGWAAATDSRRLAAAEVPTPPGTDLVVPGDVLRAVVRLGAGYGCKVSATDRQITFEVGSTLLTSTLIVEPYPDWRAAATEDAAEHLCFDRIALREALQRLTVIASRDTLRTVQIRPQDGGLILRTCVPDLGDQVELVPGSTTLPAVAFGLHYLDDVAEACREEKLVLRSTGKPSTFTVREPGFYAMLLSIRM